MCVNKSLLEQRSYTACPLVKGKDHCGEAEPRKLKREEVGAKCHSDSAARRAGLSGLLRDRSNSSLRRHEITMAMTRAWKKWNAGAFASFFSFLFKFLLLLLFFFFFFLAHLHQLQVASVDHVDRTSVCQALLAIIFFLFFFFFFGSCHAFFGIFSVSSQEDSLLQTF